MEASQILTAEAEGSDQIKDICQASKDEELRRSDRPRNPTEKMLAFQREEAHKKEKRLMHLYDQWKIQARKARNQLKLDIPESEIAALIDILEKCMNDVTDIYVQIRDHLTPSSETRRRVDACEAVTKDIIKIAYERISGIDEDYDSEAVKERLRELLNRDYAHSIYGSTVSPPSQHTIDSIVAVKRADAAAELAAKEAEYELLLAEGKQKERIQLLVEQQKRDLEAQKHELERLRAEKDIRAARARLSIYNQEVMQEGSLCSANSKMRNQEHMHPHQAVSPAPVQHLTRFPASPPQTDVSHLAQAVQDSIAMNRLPMPEPPVFTGDPIQFIEWKSSFISLIDKRNICSADKLHYLRRYVGGPARKTLDGIFYREDDEAYKDAWDRLNSRYGQPFVLQRAFREKLASWPKIHSKDAEQLRAFADFLHACQQAMPHIKGLDILNDCEENQKLVQKLPEWAASRWNRKVTQFMKDRQEFPAFQDFVNFMSLEAEIACNPVTSLHALRLSDLPAEKHHLKERKNKSTVLHTQTLTENEKNVPSKTSLKHPCMFCHDNKHRLHSCPEFKGTSLEEKRKYVRENKLCYGCLKPGHNVKDCRHRHLCDICKGRHPTCLHDDRYSNMNPVLAPNQNTDEAATTLSLNTETEHTSTTTSMILPVWVSSSNNPGIERLVYALLDTQSDTVFIDEDVSRSLTTKTYPVRLKLTTMIGKDTVTHSERVSGLRVRGYTSTNHIDLPPAYTKDCIPVNRRHIPTGETARHWNHLKAIADDIPPHLDCEVGLLIGYNCSQALAPRQVILGRDNEPYAVRTDLGWSIIGCSPPHLESPPVANICHRVTVKELPPVTPSDAIKVLESDFKDISKDSRTVSQDDILFLNMLKESIYMNAHGHYEMPLPFKERPHLPNNKQLAIIRLNHLKRKLLNNKNYKTHYITFLNEVIKNNDAEEVLCEEKEGETWYIPHHGVYHSKKPEKLRVVFDCSAKYKGTCLNDHLLSGPDLTNTLTGVLIRFRQNHVALMCDIERMFHQFHVREADRDYLRFLWWKDGNFSVEPQEFRMKVHLFGAASSPGCANYGLKHLAKENESLFPLGSQFIMRDFYVDDGVTSIADVDEAIQLAKEAQRLCAMGGLRLHKFVCNNAKVLESIAPSERATEVKALDLAFSDSSLERALGIHWHIESDTFRFHTRLKDQPETRREQVTLSDRLSKFSSWCKVKQAVARLLRRAKSDKSTSHSTVQEREDAQRIIIRDLQRRVYPDEIQLLSNGLQLSRQSKLFRLDAFLDKDGILKVGGRLKNASLPASQKHPMIIPKDHHIARMIIAHHHEQVKHQGRGITINEIRSNGYWIPGMNRAVASYVHQCVKCRKLRGSVEEQRMADLPSDRVDPSPPFTYCGMDCFGPFFTKQGRKVNKRYGLLFTCLCCRAIHIEMVNDMSADAFINGLRCFVSIRGAVRQIRCDQGSNFVRAKNEMYNALKQMDVNRLSAFLAERQCDFIMNAPHSSHVGGVWERQIRTVRNVLRSTLSLSPGRLDDGCLRTLFYEAMSIVNSRPLTVDNLNDPNGPEPLTPNHLLTMKPTGALPPPGTFIREDMYARKRWRHIQYLAEQFWNRWRREYLSNIATRQRWHIPRRNLKVGDIVIERMDDLPRNEWRLARVEDTVADKDGLVRKVKIRLGDQKMKREGQCSGKPSIVERPIQKLILLLEAV
ncbi:unnamed protein product [Oreochromis niloticus]|nr:unnamed protein product [Mustela putorius furo]